MKQLVKLHKMKAEFDALDVQLISVLREEKEQVEGLKKAHKKTQFDLLLVDTPVTQTSDYSKTGFATYFIDKRGKITAATTGSKFIRPSAKEVLATAKAVFRK